MPVVQLYEALLVGLGAFLVRTGRAPRDGVTVLVLESLFLMDAPLLAVECVTADARVGTAVALGLAALAAAKLAWVRRASPDLLSSRAATAARRPAVSVLAVPVAAAHLAEARLLARWRSTGSAGRRSPCRSRSGSLRDGDVAGRPAEAPRAHAVWTWVPAAMALLHLWAVGYVHAIPFQPAFLAPFLLGLALTSAREQPARQGGPSGRSPSSSRSGNDRRSASTSSARAAPSSLPCASRSLGVAITWAYLVWRDRERWLALLALGGAGRPAGRTPRHRG